MNGVTFRITAWEKLCGRGGADWCSQQACGVPISNVSWLKGGGSSFFEEIYEGTVLNTLPLWPSILCIIIKRRIFNM